MRRFLWPVPAIALCAALASCASTPASTPARATVAGFVRSYDAALRSNPAACGAWAAYCDSVQGDMDRFYRAEPGGRYEASFDAEYAAREALINAYSTLHSAGNPAETRADAYLDDLLAIRESGYLRQYVFYEFNPGDWARPAGLEENDYFSWMRACYPRHSPRTQGLVRRTTAVDAGAALVQEANMAQWSSMEKRTVELSFISLAGFWLTDPDKAAEAMSGLLARMLPRQEIVWGPALHRPAPDFPGGAAKPSDALEFICRDIDSGEYYVVFRGTNPVSLSEWLFQDIIVQRQVPWRRIQAGPAPEGALVSEGTATAIALRLALRPAKGAKGEGLSLADALVDIIERSPGRCAVHFTGHSLGGLLAPTMALWLVDYLTDARRGDLLLKLDMDIYSYAAPTAGNRSFAAYCELRLPGYARYANDLDVAPLAWSETTLQRIPSLYKPSIGMQPITKALYDIVAKLAQGKGYAQPTERVAVPAKIAPTYRDLYLLEAVYQHSVPYLDMLLPERKETILREVIEPLAKLVPLAWPYSIDIPGFLASGS